MEITLINTMTGRSTKATVIKQTKCLATVQEEGKKFTQRLSLRTNHITTDDFIFVSDEDIKRIKTNGIKVNQLMNQDQKEVGELIFFEDVQEEVETPKLQAELLTEENTTFHNAYHALVRRLRNSQSTEPEVLHIAGLVPNLSVAQEIINEAKEEASETVIEEFLNKPKCKNTSKVPMNRYYKVSEFAQQTLLEAERLVNDMHMERIPFDLWVHGKTMNLMKALRKTIQA